VIVVVLDVVVVVVTVVVVVLVLVLVLVVVVPAPGEVDNTGIYQLSAQTKPARQRRTPRNRLYLLYRMVVACVVDWGLGLEQQ
jgi:hypothetical protein